MKSKLNQCVTDGAVSINAPPIVRLFVFPQWDIYTGAEIILDETLYVRMGKKKKKLKERKNVSPRRGEKITPLVVFLRFFLDGTMDLVGTVQLQNTL